MEQHRASRWIAWLCAFAGAAVAAPAPQPMQVGDNAVPAFTVYTSRDGLSDEIWASIGFDADGFVWAGSASTLARFDGYRWTPAVLPEAHSLVRDMQLDGQGTLWAIFERESLARYDGSRWQLAGETSYFHEFSTIVVDGKTTVWAGHEHGFSRLVDGVWQDDPGNAGITSGVPVATAQTSSLFGAPRQWMATAARGLWYRELQPVPGPWTQFKHAAVDSGLATDLMRSDEGHGEELWLLTYGSGLIRIRDDGVRTWRAARGELPSEALYYIAETHTSGGERLLWIASRAGLLRVRGEQIDVFDRRHGLPSDAVRGVRAQRGPDGTDLLWLATEGGIVRAALADSPWQTVSLMGARENGVFGVMLEPDGEGGERLWAGSAKEGLQVLQHDAWSTLSKAGGQLPAEAVRGIWRLPDADGHVHRVLGMVGAGLLEIDDALQVHPLPTPWTPQPEEAATYAMSRTLDGVVEWWVGTLRNGVFRLREGTWTHFDASGATSPWAVLRIEEQIDRRGRAWLWAAGPQGIARFDGAAWKQLPGVLGLTDGARGVSVLGTPDAPELWVSTNRSGVVRLDVSDPMQPRLLGNAGIPPPPDPTVYSTLRDSRGRIYLCTNNGVQQLTPQPGGGYADRVFRRRDGLVHDECNTNSQAIDSRDRYWVGTLGGLSVFDPDIQADLATPRPRPLFFTAMRVDGVDRPLPAPEPIELAAGLRDLRIEYTLLAGLRENESRYRSELLGYDKQPTDWSAEHGRSFANLPPGDHTLRIEASDYNGTVAQPRELHLRIAPRWWQRTSLQLLLLATALIAIALAFRSYNRGLRARQRQLVGEVAARTAELSAANELLTELSYLDPLTGLPNRRRLMEAMNAEIERAHLQHLPVGLIVIDVDHFKAYNDRHGHLAGDMALRAVATALASATREHDLVARFGGEEFACLMIDVDLATVTRTAERMRALVEALPPRSLGNDDHTVTISAGVLHCVPRAGEHAEELLRSADVALYAAKNAGRNRVTRAGA